MRTIFFVFMIFYLSSCGSKKVTKATSERSKSIEFVRKETSRLENEKIFPANDSRLQFNDSLFYKGVYYNNIGEYDRALRELTKFSKLHPAISATYFQMARAHLGKDSSLETIYKFIYKAYELDPENKWYMKYYADLISLKGEYLEAATVYNDLIDKGNYDKEYFLKAFINYQKAEEYDSLFSIIEKIDRYTDFEDEYIEKLTLSVHHLKKNNDVVEEMLLKKIEESEDTVESQIELIEFYIETEQFDKKEKLLADINYFGLENEKKGEFLTALILNYDTQSVNEIMRTVFINMNDTAEINFTVQVLIGAWDFSPRTIQSYIRMMKRWSEDPDVSYYVPVFLMGYYMAVEDYDSTLMFSQRAFDQGYMDISNYSILFLYYLRSDSTDYLRKLSETALERDPEYAIAHYSQALTSLYDNDMKAAYEKMLLAGRYADTSDYNTAFISEIYMYMGDTYQQLEGYDQLLVMSYYDTSLLYNPENEVVLNNYAYYLSVMEDRLDKADSMSSASLKKRPSDPNFLDTYAWIQYKLGNYETAKEYLLKAIENSKDPSSTLWEHLGDVEVKLDNKEKAIDYYKIAIDAQGDEDTLRVKIRENEKQ